MVVLEVLVQQISRRCYSVQVPQTLPVIRIPAYVNRYIEKKKKKDGLKLINLRKKISYRGDTSFPVISSTDKEYNFYLGQIYNQHYPIPIQSKYWFKTKSSGQKFTINPWDTNPSLPVLINDKHQTDVDFPKSFSELLLNECVLQDLNKLKYESPTPIQVLTIPTVFEKKHLLLAAETGCGKTLAYLAPIIQNISYVKKSTQLFPNTPLALIITPGRELAEQIGRHAYALSESSDVKVKVIVPDGTKHEYLRLTENCNVDLLVATFGTISNLVKHGIFKLANLRHVVLDEADTLLDDSFIDDVKSVLNRIPVYYSSRESNVQSYSTQLILVSSIYPSNADSFLLDLFEVEEDFQKIKSPYLHRVLPHVKQRFWRVSNDGRSGELLDLVKSDYTKKKPVMIFCNHSPTCDWMSHFLDENDVPNVKYHAGLSYARRSKSLSAFESGLCNVMCCTDLASRGLDTQHVKHVINFDFPTSVSDYILRAGRVGRVGTNDGKVTNFVVSAAGVYTVQEIEKAVRASVRLPDVDSNIKKKIRKLYFNP